MLDASDYIDCIGAAPPTIGATSDGTYIWATGVLPCVLRIHIVNRSTQAFSTVPVAGDSRASGAVILHQGSVWLIASGNASTMPVVRVNVSDGAMTAISFPNDVASQIGRTSFYHAVAVGVDRLYMLPTDNTKYVVIMNTTSSSMTLVASPSGHYGTAFDGRYIWLVGNSGFVYYLDTETNVLKRSVATPKFVLAPQHCVFNGVSVFCAFYLGNHIEILSPTATQSVEPSVSFGSPSAAFSSSRTAASPSQSSNPTTSAWRQLGLSPRPPRRRGPLC
jgi:hypothetical protein